MFGDSNARHLHAHACHVIGGTVYDIYGDNEQWSVCFSQDGMKSFLYSVSLMLKNQVITIGQSILGSSLSAICGDPRLPPIPECAQAWGLPAKITLVSIGSHYPQLMIPNAIHEIEGWLKKIAQEIQVKSSIVLQLTNSFCIHQYKQVPQIWGQLFQTHNNYRSMQSIDNPLL